MTNEERQLLLGLTQEVQRLFKERDDMIVGVTATLLDLYRMLFASGADTKEAALGRLRAQHAQILKLVPGGQFGPMLQAVIQSLDEDRLDAAKLFRTPPAGSAETR
jgi:hypothetical protein